LISYGVL
jgi:hypothetical protein